VGNRYGVYGEKLADLVQRLRADLNKLKLPFVACTIGLLIKPKAFLIISHAGVAFPGNRYIPIMPCPHHVLGRRPSRSLARGMPLAAVPREPIHINHAMPAGLLEKNNN